MLVITVAEVYITNTIYHVKFNFSLHHFRDSVLLYRNQCCGTQ